LSLCCLTFHLFPVLHGLVISWPRVSVSLPHVIMLWPREKNKNVRLILPCFRWY
jgi:hypothetical protein